MLFNIIAFLAGDLYLQTFSHLPAKILVYPLVTIVIISLVKLKNYFPYTPLFLAFLLGFTYTFWYANAILAWELPKELESKSVLVTGYISSLPELSENGMHFLFAIRQLQYGSYINPQHSMIKLTWRDALIPLKVGDKWQLVVHLKRIHGYQNPGGFDYEAWAFQNKLRANGYVITDVKNQRLRHAWFYHPIDQLRQYLQEKIKAANISSTTSPWLNALIIGERSEMTASDWDVLRHTGTNHLIAIAGLHIGMIAGFTYVFFTWCIRRFPALLLYFPAQHIGAIAALSVGLFYSALAGFSLPTIRACMMLALFSVSSLMRVEICAWQVWSLALFLILLLNPLSVLAESFWLSFATIAFMIYGMNARIKPTTLWWKWGRAQWVIGMGLIPLSLLFFGQCSLISFIANMIAIPFLGFLILPLCFLSAIFLCLIPPLGKLGLMIADKNLSILWKILTYFSSLPMSILQFDVSHYLTFISLLLGIILFLSPAGFPSKLLSIIAISIALFYKTPAPKNGEYWLTLLDVGQGLSLVIQTQHHIVVYDAGPKYGAQFDMGESILLPYLRTLAIHKIDLLVVSHGDNDHMGGVDALVKAYPIKTIKTSVIEKISGSRYCMAGDKWQWDGVAFTFIYPSVNELHLGNDSSCVLKINNGKHSVLIPGDIEKYAETKLLQTTFTELPSELLIAPHHGSKTSGKKEFIDTVHPSYVLYAIGYRNRYHFPHPSIITQYAKMASMQLNTAQAGALRFEFGKEKSIIPPDKYRLTHQHYWF